MHGADHAQQAGQAISLNLGRRPMGGRATGLHAGLLRHEAQFGPVQFL
jgi:hypothetical protein